MNKKIVLSIEQMMHLEELGLDTSDAHMYWNIFNKEGYDGELIDLQCWNLDGPVPNNPSKGFIPTYTLQDILPYFNELCKYEDFEYRIHYDKIDEVYSIRLENPYHNEAGDTLLECAFNTLVWCIENNYIKTNKYE